MVNRSEFFAFDFLKAIGDKGGREALLHRVLTVAEQQAELHKSKTTRLWLMYVQLGGSSAS